MRSLAFLLPLVLAAACRPAAAPAQPAAVDTLARIRALAAAPSCADDSQCHTLALGASACGGPESYLPWSSVRSAPEQMEALGKIYAAERRRSNAASGRMGACRVTPDPGAVCRAGMCALGAAAPGIQ